MKTKVNLDALTPTDQIVGEDEEETLELNSLLQEARSFLSNFSWCLGIRREFFGIGVGGVVGVFLFDLNVPTGVDGELWVVTGDLPSAYLVTDRAPTPTAALRVYCELMDDWIRAVRGSGDLSKAFPVGAQPTKENANQLEKRVRFLREEIIPAFEEAADT
jgi:hypothetical protein